MHAHSSSQELGVTESERPQAVAAISQDEQQETKQPKDYTSSIVGWILQGGVMLSAGIILIGLLMLPFYTKGLSLSELLSFPQTLGQIWGGLQALQPQSIIALGLLLLIATPILRVAVSIVAFALERDLRFVVITALVLGILIISNVLLGHMIVNTNITGGQQIHFTLPVLLFIFGGAIAAGTL